jgi:hypothetical protein
MHSHRRLSVSLSLEPCTLSQEEIERRFVRITTLLVTIARREGML